MTTKVPTTTTRSDRYEGTRAAYFSLSPNAPVRSSKNRGKFVRCPLCVLYFLDSSHGTNVGGRFGKANAALVAWRCRLIFTDVAIFHQRAEQWRQQLLAVAGHRGNSASGDRSSR
ncbi:hypothetical protein ACLK19_27815 [Escherichia coli]